MRRALPLMILALAPLGACAESAEDAGALAQGDMISQALALLDEPWCTPFAERFCAAATSCGCAAATGWPGDCLVAARAQCHRDLRVQAEALGDGGFLVSSDAAPHCLTLLDDALARCEQPERSRFTAECRLVVAREGEGLPRAGERCVGGLCGRGLRCATDQVCRVPRPAGERCFSEGDCLSPLVCRSDCTRAPECPQVCAERPEASTGQACAPEFGTGCVEGALCHMSSRRTCQPLQAGTCQSDLDCPQGEVCGAKGTLTCSPLPGLGEFCGDRLQCRAGLACDFGTFMCVEGPRRGEPCVGIEFGLEQCAVGLVCRDGLCGSPGAEGEACRFGETSCQAGLGCDFDNAGMAVCQPFRDVDGRCQSDLICGPTNFCDFGTLTCQARLAEGERCQAGGRCLGDMQCVEAEPGELRCQPVLVEGDACGGQCPAGLSCKPVSTSSTCVHAMCGMLRL